ncbi:MAG: cytosolic protein [Dehalococcoidia bacterium]|nr:MAG: cytosolic protein [Dehalococcoidia bacterium]
MAGQEELSHLNSRELSELAIDFLRRSALHYGLWFNEVQHQLGLDEAINTEAAVFEKYYPIILKRLSGVLGFDVDNGLPAALTSLPREKIIDFIDAVSVNWLAGDGLWFQAVEQRQEMFTAKRCNDTCWTKFSPIEAYRIKDLLHLPELGGLEALETALGYRLYSRINVQSTEREAGNLIFRMVECRVQVARKRKGLEDYPCKSAGVVEYSSFARAIDPRIKTECIACPPDIHPEEFCCAWKFYIA